MNEVENNGNKVQRGETPRRWKHKLSHKGTSEHPEARRLPPGDAR